MLTYTYDSRGLPLTATDSFGITTFEFDGDQQLVTQTDAAGGITRLGYDASGRVISGENPAGEITRFARNTLDQIVEVTAANASTYALSYDPFGRLVSVTREITTETVPALPMAAYGQSKFCAEAYCGWYERLYGLSVVTLRYGNVYGPRQDPAGEAGVIAIFCGKLLEGGTPTIFGDGEQTRDYVYVGDVVDANVRAASSDATGAINIGRGVQTSVLDIVNSLARHSNNGFGAEHAPARPGEVQHIALDPSRAREELGWEAKVDLDEGLERTLASLR